MRQARARRTAAEAFITSLIDSYNPCNNHMYREISFKFIMGTILFLNILDIWIIPYLS